MDVWINFWNYQNLLNDIEYQQNRSSQLLKNAFREMKISSEFKFDELFRGNNQTALFIANAMESQEIVFDVQNKVREKPRYFDPMLGVLGMTSHVAHQLAVEIGNHGLTTTLASSPFVGIQAIGEAAEYVEHSEIKEGCFVGIVQESTDVSLKERSRRIDSSVLSSTSDEAYLFFLQNKPVSKKSIQITEYKEISFVSREKVKEYLEKYIIEINNEDQIIKWNLLIDSKSEWVRELYDRTIGKNNYSVYLARASTVDGVSQIVSSHGPSILIAVDHFLQVFILRTN